MLCSLTRDSKKENVEKKKVWFAEDVKQLSKAGMMCTIDGNTIFLFMKNTWIGDLGASCHITKDNDGICDIIDINESIQGSFGVMPATKKGMLQVIVCQANGEEQVHTLWTAKVCPTAGVNLFFLSCKLLQGKKISSNHFNNIMINTPSGNIILDC